MKKILGFGILGFLFALWFGGYAVTVGFWKTLIVFGAVFGFIGLIILAIYLIVDEETDA